MGDRFVNTSLIAAATSKTQPIVRSEIVDGDDPTEGEQVGKSSNWELLTTCLT